jgi:uncharacterized membrane protein YeaQ/YmgE (transglycosylase-associated protein family)
MEERMTTNQPDGNDALRWLAFIPAAVAGGVIAPIIIGIANAIAPDWWENTLGEIIKSAVSGIGFVYLGAVTAPRSRFPVSVVLVVIFGILNGWIMGRAGLTPWLTVNIVVGIVAALGTCGYIKSEFPEKEAAR